METNIRDELKLAHSLLEQFLGIKFLAPEPYIGGKHESRFIQISSLRDLARASMIMIRGVYDDEINGMLVPDRLAEVEHEAERIFTFVHECGHAFSAQLNPRLKRASVFRLIQSRAKRTREKGYVYIAFDEGLATYLAVQACLCSDRSDLAEYAKSSHKKLVNFFAEWMSPTSRSIELMAGVHELDPNDWKKVIGAYLNRSMEAGLGYYKYDLGYYLMRTLQPDSRMILQMTEHPPSTIQHILYPEIYRSEKLARN